MLLAAKFDRGLEAHADTLAGVLGRVECPGFPPKLLRMLFKGEAGCPRLSSGVPGGFP